MYDKALDFKYNGLACGKTNKILMIKLEGNPETEEN